jgi:hypothetical protein
MPDENPTAPAPRPKNEISIVRVLGFAATLGFFNFVFGALALAWSTAFKPSVSDPQVLELLLVILNPLGWLFDRRFPAAEVGSLVHLFLLACSGLLYGVAFAYFFPPSPPGAKPSGWSHHRNEA